MAARWQTVKAIYGYNAQSTVHADHAIIPEHQGHTDEELLEMLYEEDQELSDFVYAIF